MSRQCVIDPAHERVLACVRRSIKEVSRSVDSIANGKIIRSRIRTAAQETQEWLISTDAGRIETLHRLRTSGPHRGQRAQRPVLIDVGQLTVAERSQRHSKNLLRALRGSQAEVVEEEKQLVLQDGAAHAAAKLIASKLGSRSPAQVV